MKNSKPTHYIINPKVFTSKQTEDLWSGIKNSPGYKIALKELVKHKNRPRLKV